MTTDEPNRPRGFTAIGVFFLFGATMAAYAAVTLLDPNTSLDLLWRLNRTARVQLASLGTAAGVGFIVLSGMLLAAGAGWLRRRYWGWVLGAVIVALNAAGDLVNLVIGEHLKGAIGVAIAGLLLLYITRPRLRNYFAAKSRH